MRATTDHSHSLSDSDSVDNNNDMESSRRRSMSFDKASPGTSTDNNNCQQQQQEYHSNYNSNYNHHHQNQGSATTESGYSSEPTHGHSSSGHQQQQGYYDHNNSAHHPSNNNGLNNNNNANGHSAPYDHYNGNNNRQQHTPSPPLPPSSAPSLSLLASSAADAFQGRTLPPIEPSHPLHSYMSNSRRGSLAIAGATTDPEYHQQQQQPYPSERDMIYRRPSITVHDASSSPLSAPTASGPSSFSPLPPPPSNGNYYNSNHGVNGGASPGTSGSTAPGGVSPTQLRHAEISAAAAAAGGRRESLPSIHGGPLGQLLAQDPPRRHSIAHHHYNTNGSVESPLLTSGGVGPLKRKSSGTRLSQVHSLSDTTHLLEHPAKRRDSIPDATIATAAAAAASHSQQQHYPYHHQSHLPSHHIHHGHGHGHGHGPYPPRSSFSAPSSPPRRGSIAAGVAASSPAAAPVPALNLQPPAEIKSSSSTMEYGRPHYPLHQPRRPSLLSESGSRRSSIAELHHPYNTNGGSPSSSAYPPHEYDHRMNMDMERMHLSSQGPEPLIKTGGPQTPSSSGGGPPPPQSLYPGYGSTNGSSPTSTTTSPPGDLLAPPKGDTPYSRSPELRVSHKMAERKRRKEMKELFDELRDSLPVDRSLKTSKWEILSKAVDFIASMKEEQDDMTREVEALRQEVSRLQQQKQQPQQPQHPHTNNNSSNNGSSGNSNGHSSSQQPEHQQHHHHHHHPQQQQEQQQHSYHPHSQQQQHQQ